MELFLEEGGPGGLDMGVALGGGGAPAYTNTTSTLFDGSAEWAEIASPGADITSGISNRMSLFMWVQSPGAGTTTAFMSHWRAGDQKWYLGQVSGGNLECILSADGSALTKRYIFSTSDSNIVFADSWCQIGFVYDGTLAAASQLQLYVNGTNVTAAATRGGEATSLPTLHQPGTDNIRLFSTSPLNFMPGNADESIIFSGALSGAEVTELYNGGVPFDFSTHSRFADAVSWWRMGDGTGDIVGQIQDQIGSNPFDTFNMNASNYVLDVP